MNKFVKGLVQDASGIKKQRAEITGKAAADAQIDLIRGLERELRVLQDELLNLTDFGPENEFDLRPTSKNFNAVVWAQSIQNNKIARMNVQIQLDAALETQEEYFTDVKPNE